MMRLVIHLIIFMVGAGIAHITSIFALPHFTITDAFSRLEDGAPINTLALVDEKDLLTLPFTDPATTLAICRYSLAEGPVRIRVSLSETFLAISFAERRRGIYSSVSDRAATAGSLDIVLATQGQLDRIAALDDEDQAIEEIRILAPRREGLAILKVFVDRPSSRERAETVLREARCDSETLPN